MGNIVLSLASLDTPEYPGTPPEIRFTNSQFRVRGGRPGGLAASSGGFCGCQERGLCTFAARAASVVILLIRNCEVSDLVRRALLLRLEACLVVRSLSEAL